MAVERLDSDRTVLDLAYERVEDCFRRFDRVVVAFSGGKDSTVILNLAADVARARGADPVEVLHWDEEAVHPETTAYVARVAAREDVRLLWYCYPVKHRNACSRESPWWYPWAEEARDLWVRDLPATAITRVPCAYQPRKPVTEMTGFALREPVSTVILTGVRAQESLQRMQSVTRSPDGWLSVNKHAPHTVNAKPMYDWRLEDVWTAPKLLGWDYNRTYDVFAAAGVALNDQRVSPPFGDESLQNLTHYAECWPELWAKLVRRVPGAATAGRYSKTAVYGFSDRRKAPPEGMTWREAIADAIRQWPEEVRPHVADNVRRAIQAYVKHNRRPVPDTAPAGEVSWSELLLLAQRGGLNGQRLRATNVTP